MKSILEEGKGGSVLQFNLKFKSVGTGKGFVKFVDNLLFSWVRGQNRCLNFRYHIQIPV